MDGSVLELLTKVTVYELLLALSLVLVLVGVILSQKKRISKWMNKWREDKNEEDDFTKLVYSLKDSIEGLKKQMDQYQVNRENDREVSKSIQKDIYKAIDKQSDDIKSLTTIIVKMQEKNSKTKRAEIKEKIERIYRECHPTKTCTDMQFETLKELIEEYEEHGGDNSFVHSVVEKEMYDWEVVTVTPSHH